MGGAAFKCGEEDLQGAKVCILSVTCIQGLRWGGAAFKCGEEDLQGAKLCILSVTCIQGLRWGCSLQMWRGGFTRGQVMHTVSNMYPGA